MSYQLQIPLKFTIFDQPAVLILAIRRCDKAALHGSVTYPKGPDGRHENTNAALKTPFFNQILMRSLKFFVYLIDLQLIISINPQKIMTG
ncbi:MAG TPA: hypothetical protein VIM16_24430 [Mucilaginibacter sp.]